MREPPNIGEDRLRASLQDEYDLNPVTLELLPDQHLVDMGYVDAEVLAQSQNRYQVEVVGPVMPDLSWLALGGVGL